MSEQQPNKPSQSGNPNWTKGVSGNPNGRPMGSPNKATNQVREAYQKLTEDNLENMTRWLSEIAADSPKEAMELMLKMSEYVLPKLARTEIAGSDGGDIFKNLRFDFGPSVNDPVGRNLSEDEEV